MKDDEWSALCFLMDQAWKGEFVQDKRDAYRVFLDRFSEDEVMAALHSLMETASPHLPAAAEIVQRIRSVSEAPVPSWAEVWKHILIPMTRGWAERQAMDYLNEIHPLIARFVQVQGYETLRTAPFFDEQYGGLRIKDLRERWEEFVGVARERAAQGRALEAVGQRRDMGPSRLDQHALLERLGAPKELPKASE